MALEDHGPEEGRLASSPLKYLPLALVLAALAAVFASGLHHKLSFDTFVQYHAKLSGLVSERPATMLGLYALVYVAAVILSLPLSAFLSTIGGYLFGWLIGGTAASLSATLGGTCFFLIARTSLGQPFLRRAGPRIQGLAAGFRRQGFSYLLVLRLIPVVPFWLTNLAAGFFRMRFKSFVLCPGLRGLGARPGHRRSPEAPRGLPRLRPDGLCHCVRRQKPADARAHDSPCGAGYPGTGAGCDQALAEP